ncbi:hypothetical protein [Buttiauxella sp.]|uniref:hypothetical protein n=1 Tax=Buttiauxella sp. TaxID=1972222 RepID=UPI003C71EE3E
MIAAESGMHLILKDIELDKAGKTISLKAQLLRVIAWTDISENNNEVFPIVIERARYSSGAPKWLNNNTTTSAFVLHHKLSRERNTETLLFSVETGATLNDIYHLANACMKAVSWNIPLLKTNNNPI